MLDDILSKTSLQKMVAGQIFETASDFLSELEDSIRQNLVLNEERMSEQSDTSGKIAYLYVLDKLTNLEPLIIIGFRTKKDCPEIGEAERQAFHAICHKKEVLYGILTTERETYIFDYRSGVPVEVSETEPMNHLDAKFERKIPPRVIQDLLLKYKYWVIGISLAIILMISISLANAKMCETNGVIKAEVKSTGEKVYYLPESSGYDQRTTGDQAGERRYCDEKDAIKDGFVLAN